MQRTAYDRELSFLYTEIRIFIYYNSIVLNENYLWYLRSFATARLPYNNNGVISVDFLYQPFPHRVYR